MLKLLPIVGVVTLAIFLWLSATSSTSGNVDVEHEVTSTGSTLFSARNVDLEHEVTNASDILSTSSVTDRLLEHRVTNVSDVSFTISWIAETPCKAYIEYGKTQALGKKAYDNRGENTVSNTHYIRIVGLLPENVYYYDITCNDVRYDNYGKHYTVSTARTMLPLLPSVILGRVWQADGKTLAGGSIVYIKVVDNDGNGTGGESQEWSRLVRGDGYWDVVFGSLRTRDLQSWFEFDGNGGDNVLLTFEGGPLGKASLEVAAEMGSGPQVLPEVQLRAAD